MYSFKELDIQPRIKTFTGDKIKVKNLLGIQIIVTDFEVKPSTVVDGTECLTIQLEKSGEKRIAFSGSKVLIDQIRRVPKEAFPFTTIIKGDNNYHEFT